MTAQQIASLITLLEQLENNFDAPYQELDQECRHNPLNIHARRTGNYLGTMLWNARNALTHANQFAAALLAETSGSSPDGGPSEARFQAS